jgi:RimJ/RimL family protein N-acetyltransferase
MSLPILRLCALDAPALEAHMLRLSEQDRSLRFAAGLVTDETVRRYVAGIDFERDLVLGIVDSDGTLVACAHGCVYTVAGKLRIEAAFSVDAALRRSGLCARLMAALEHGAQAMRAEALVAMCVARNLPMRRCFERAGMRTSREEDEVHAVREFAAA